MKAESLFRCGRSCWSPQGYELLWILGQRRDLVEDYMRAPAMFWLCIRVEVLAWRIKINGMSYFRLQPLHVRVRWGSEAKFIRTKTSIAEGGNAI